MHVLGEEVDPDGTPAMDVSCEAPNVPPCNPVLYSRCAFRPLTTEPTVPSTAHVINHAQRPMQMPVPFQQNVQHLVKHPVQVPCAQQPQPAQQVHGLLQPQQPTQPPQPPMRQPAHQPMQQAAHQPREQPVHWPTRPVGQPLQQVAGPIRQPVNEPGQATWWQQLVAPTPNELEQAWQETKGRLLRKTGRRCKNYNHETKSCPYADKCCFMHPGDIRLYRPSREYINTCVYIHAIERRMYGPRWRGNI